MTARGAALAVIVCVVGCGRVGFTPDAGPRRPVPRCDWRVVAPEFAVATRLGEPISIEGARDQDPFVDGAGNLWFSSDRADGTRMDTYVAQRLPTGELGPPERVDALSRADADDGAVHLFDDDRVVVRSAGGAGNETLFLHRRDEDGGVGFLQGEPIVIEGLPPPSRHHDPFIGIDPVAGRIHLYWAPLRNGRPTQDLYVATRSLEPGARFGGAALIPLSSSVHAELDPSLDVSLSILVFESDRPGGTLWWSTREDPESAWSEPVALPPLGPARDRDPFLEPDGCALWFVSERDDDPSTRDLWRVELSSREGLPRRE